MSRLLLLLLTAALAPTSAGAYSFHVEWVAFEGDSETFFDDFEDGASDVPPTSRLLYLQLNGVAPEQDGALPMVLGDLPSPLDLELFTAVDVVSYQQADIVRPSLNASLRVSLRPGGRGSFFLTLGVPRALQYATDPATGRTELYFAPGGAREVFSSAPTVPIELWLRHDAVFSGSPLPVFTGTSSAAYSLDGGATWIDVTQWSDPGAPSGVVTSWGFELRAAGILPVPEPGLAMLVGLGLAAIPGLRPRT